LGTSGGEVTGVAASSVIQSVHPASCIERLPTQSGHRWPRWTHAPREVSVAIRKRVLRLNWSPGLRTGTLPGASERRPGCGQWFCGSMAVSRRCGLMVAHRTIQAHGALWRCRS